MPQLIIPVLTAIGIGTTAATIGAYVLTAAATLGATRLITKRALSKAKAGGDGGGRVQFPPATDNKIPVVYGSAFMSGPIIDAYITADQKTMYYVLALSEKTDNGTISFGDIYYDGKLVTFTSDGAGGTTRVASLTTNTSTAQVDPRVDGNLFMYFYNNGSTSPTNTTLNAYDVMPSWTSSMAMTNCAFVIVKVNYNVDAATTNLGALTCEIINTESGESTGVYRPGTAIYDYLTNTRYGCAIPSAKVDTASLTALNTYSDATITYVPVGGGSSTQPRYRINGPLDTAASCLDNLQILVDSCDSWLQYSEMTGEWKVVINAPYATTPFEINASNIIGGVQVSPLDLNDTYNELEVGYPNANIKDQTDYQVLLLSDYQAGLLSPNEAVNRLNISYPVVNNAVQAKYLGVRRLLQSREDLVISLNLDFSGIQIEAGDVVSVTHATYGWTNKLFRVSQVSESKDMEGRLGASIVAFEYNATIYNDNSIQDFVPAFNTGLLNPNVFDAPTVPVVATAAVANASTTSFNVSSNVPGNGAIIYMDFNYGNSSNTQQHLLYRTVQPGPGTTFTANSTITVNVNDVPAGNLYWSATARNDFAGRQSNASNVYVWAGPAVSSYDANTGQGGIGTAQLQPNIIGPNIFPPDIQPIQVVNALPGTCSVSTEGQTVYLTTDGKLYICNGTNFEAVASNNLITGNIVASQIANVFGNTITGTISNAGFPSANLIGNIVASQISNVANTAIIGNIVAAQISNIANTQVIGQFVESQIANAAITQDKLAANSVVASKIVAGTITTTQIATGTITATNIAANAITANAILANAVTAVKIAAGAVEADKIAANAVTANAILANAVVAGKIAADAVGANQILANAITAVKIDANAVTSDKIFANAVTTSKIAAGAITAGLIAANAVAVDKLISGTSANNSGNIFGLGSGMTISGQTGVVIGLSYNANIYGGLIGATDHDSLGAGCAKLGGYAVAAYGGMNNAFTTWQYAGTLGGINAGNTDGSGAFCTDNTNTIQAVLVNSTYAGYFIGNVFSTGTYTPFTGSHQSIIASNTTAIVGDILVDQEIIAKSGISETATLVDLSNTAIQKGGIGVYTGESGTNQYPLAMCDIVTDTSGTFGRKTAVLKPEYANLMTTHKTININALGEGQINVVGENGNIEIGDLIVTSSTPGKGMKQTDDVIRSTTVAKARENVTFASTTEEKQIACIYLAG